MGEIHERERTPNLLLRRHRELRGWSQGHVAKELQALFPGIAVTARHVARWESGKRRPGPYYREKLCALFQTTADKLGFIPQHGPFEQNSEDGELSPKEEKQNSSLEDPINKDMICHVTEVVHQQQEITDQALRLLGQICEMFACEGIERAKTTESLASHLEKEDQYSSQEVTDSEQIMPHSGSSPSQAQILPSITVATLQYNMLVVPTTILSPSNPAGITHVDCATFFGVQLAEMTTLIRQWYGMATFCNELQDQLDRTIKNCDQIKMQYPLEEYTLSRRSLLMTLALLPTSLLASRCQGWQATLVLEELLPTCAASITACWYLSGGTHLNAILPIVDSYLPTLITTCKYAPAYREVAADLVAQVYFLKAILAWHLEGLEIAERYCIEGRKYGDLTKNVNLRLTSLNQHALISYYRRDFPKALAKSEEADAVLHERSHEHIFPIVEGRVCMYLAAIRAQQRVKDAEFTLDRAHMAFTRQANVVESIPVYADCGNASLLLWDGLTYYYLGPRSTGHAERAFTSLSTFGQKEPDTEIPERFRLECLNSRLLAAIQLDNLEEAIACYKAGQQGAKVLGSKQRSAELDYAHLLMCEQWPTEERVKKLRGPTPS
jgi:transcriptional regulator with XRE-family HTH domain